MQRTLQGIQEENEERQTDRKVAIQSLSALGEKL
jgi:hypothetical protein